MCMDKTLSACRLRNAITTQISRQTHHSPPTDSPSSSVPSLNIITHIKSKRYKSCHLLPVLAVFTCGEILNVRSSPDNSATLNEFSGSHVSLIFRSRVFTVLPLEQGPKHTGWHKGQFITQNALCFYFMYRQISLSLSA